MKKRSGFTLIELMIAMAIIAILATAGIQAYTGYMKKGRDSARAQIAQNLNSSVMAYAASNGGKPPGDMAAFDNFLRDAGDTFGGGISGSGSTAFIKDPVGGKAVCLDADGNADEPCAFHYTAYDDGTYAISYGVEDKASMEKDFYKTTQSVARDDNETKITPITAQVTKPKYGVYVGSAPFIGSPVTKATDVLAQDNITGVDQAYTPPGGGGTIVPLVVTFRSIRVDDPVGVTKIASGSTCTTSDICEGTLSCISGQCLASNVAGGGVCTVAGQCTGSLSCISGQCLIANVAVNGACTVAGQCAEGLTCTGGTCQAPDPCVTTPVAGTVCADGTVYVTPTMRTTPNDAGIFIWATSGYYTGATSATDGAYNTNILNWWSNPAAYYCTSSERTGGYTNWYLPSKNELATLYSYSNCNKNGNHLCNATGAFVTGFTNSSYWSSTESTLVSNAWYVSFFNGYTGGSSNKGNNYRIRCIRTP